MPQAPWDFLEGRDAPETGFSAAEPVPCAVELGKHLAGFADQEYAATGRDTRCETCAFRAGTNANTTLNVANATKCAIEGTPFYCHETDRPCGGWASLMRSSSNG